MLVSSGIAYKSISNNMNVTDGQVAEHDVSRSGGVAVRPVPSPGTGTLANKNLAPAQLVVDKLNPHMSWMCTARHIR